MEKFNRNYSLIIDTNDNDTITINPELTVEFSIVRNTMSSANTGEIRIYNLSKRHRERLFKDIHNYDITRGIRFYAGYGNDLNPIMNGTVAKCISVREGSNYVTTIECFDSGAAFTNAECSDQTYKSGTSYRNIIIDLIRQLKPHGVILGTVGQIAGEIKRDTAFTGSVIKVLTELTGGAFFVENGVANVLSDSETLSGKLPKINSASGLLNTPVRSQNFLNFEMLLETSLVSGQSIVLETITGDKTYNGTYKIISLHHSGVISKTMSGRATTKVGLFKGFDAERGK